MRLSNVTAGQIKDLAERYGTQTTALTVAIDKLWRDTMNGTQVRGEYHMERITSDTLGDTDRYAPEQLTALVERQTRAAEAAIVVAGWTPIWDDVRIHTTGHAYPEDGSPDYATDAMLEDLVRIAVDHATDSWLREGCPTE